MKFYSLLLKSLVVVLLICVSCDKSQINKKKSSEEGVGLHTTEEYPNMSINPNIEMDSLNKEIIHNLKSFLSNKNLEPQDKLHWKGEDFEIFPFPYQDILYIEQTREEEFGYRPVVLEILTVQDEYNRIVKVGFVHCNENFGRIRCIYNLIIDIRDFKFSRILAYNTRNWNRYKVGNIEYFVSPNRKFDEQQGFAQHEFNIKLGKLFDSPPVELTYYSCVTPKELFEIKGFDYIPNMYLSNKGGLNEVASGIIFSGNDSDRYDHELVHSYLYEGYGNTIYNLPLLSEGLATYFGGSGNNTYSQLRHALKTHLEINKNFEIDKFLNPYSRDELVNEISYTIGALICELALRKSENFNAFRVIFEQKSLDEALTFINVKRGNLLSVLVEELEKPIYMVD